MEFRIVDHRSLDSRKWDNLVGEASFFQTRDWANICSQGLSADFGPENVYAVFLCGYEEDRLVAGLPAVITRKFGLESFYSMLNDTYGSVVSADHCSPESKRAFLTHLADYFKKKEFSKIAITDFDGNLSGWTAFPMDRTRQFTHIIDLATVGEYKPHKKVMGDLRTGRRANSKIVKVEKEEQVDAFYRLYRLTEKKHGKKRLLYRKMFFQTILKHLHDSKKLYWIALMAEDKMVGSQIHFIHGGGLINWQTVSDYEMRHYKPNQLLMYRAIEKGIALGVKTVNLGASPPGAEGLIFYKERWGGLRKEYDVLTHRSGIRRLLGR